MPSPIRVLLVEDREDDAELIRRELSRAGLPSDCRRVDTEEAFLEALRDDWDVILSDFSMPSFNGLKAFSLVREHNVDVPFIFVSGAIGEERAAEAMRVGARDYVLKGNLRRLSEAVRRELDEYETRRRRREAEDLIRDHERRLAMAVDATGAGIFEHGEERASETYVNSRWTEICGYSAAEVTSAPRFEVWLSERIHPEDAGAFTAEYTALLDGRVERCQIDCRIRHAKGHYFDSTLFAKAVSRDARGRARHVAGVLMDVTERRRLETEMRQTQKMEAVGRLAGGIAHDFNNVLTVILSFARFSLEETPRDHVVHGDLEEIILAAKRAESLTRQLLAFSRRQPVNPRVLNVNTLVAGIDRMLRRVLGEDIEYETRLCPDLFRVRMDPGALEQVIMNLAINARDAMPAGGKLRIETANVELDGAALESRELDIGAGSYVLLTVADTGTGMDEAVQSRAFEPFFTTKPVGKGTGLGLSTCYGIVKQAFGDIAVRSRPGAGTAFEVYVPRCLEKLSDENLTPHAKIKRGTEAVLVVEDQEQVRRATVRVLRSAGYRVHEASNGRDALALLRAETPIDLLLTDVVMPTMNGRELAAELKRVRPNLKVLFMSGYADDSISQGGEEGPPYPLLAKPFSPAELAAKLRELLDPPEAGASQSEAPVR